MRARWRDRVLGLFNNGEELILKFLVYKNPSLKWSLRRLSDDDVKMIRDAESWLSQVKWTTIDYVENIDHIMKDLEEIKEQNREILRKLNKKD